MQALQAVVPRAAATELPADLALIKELVSTSDFKFQVPAASSKLLSIKHLPAWFSAITKMLSRFPDPEAFLFGTTASLNSGSELQLRTVAVKTEASGVKLENAAPGAPDLVKLIKEELRLFNAPITTFSVFDQFLQATSYRKQIMADRNLQHLVAPTILQPSMEARTLLSRAQQFKSPEYQETVTLDEHTGLTLVSDQRVFVFPSEQRMTSVKAVTFHYVRGDRKPEVKVHQLLRPHFWRWLKVALTGTDFAHLLTLGWECDHTWVFGRLIEQQDNEREESDQLFAILAVQDELRTKSPSENLMTWYVKALKTIDDLNAVTRTYREGCGLMILPVQLAESMYKVHAHREGYAEVMSRVARDNKGYMPILELQKAIAMIVVDKNRQKLFSNFDSERLPMGHANPSQVNSTVTNPSGKLQCCYKFLEGKCQDTNCKHPHLQVPVPAGVCSEYLADKKSCAGSCGKLHERWGNIIRKANEGKLNISPAKPRKPRQAKQGVAPSSQPTDDQGNDSDSDSGGQGSQAPEKSGTPGSQPCTRCGKAGHEFESCYSSTHFDGSRLISPKPCPVPEDFWAIDQTWEAHNDANQKADINAVRVTDDQYMDNGTHYSEEEAYWPTYQINVLCDQRTAADVQRTAIIHLEPDSVVIATEGSKRRL